MFAWLKYIGLVPALVGLVQGAVALVEAVKKDGPGPEKKAAALAMIHDGWDAAQAAFGFKVPYEAVAPMLGWLIDAAVAIYNAVGWFEKKPKA